jgi:hypothetical protein
VADLRQRAWARWQAAAGPWRGWAICPALSMPTESPSRGAAQGAHIADLMPVQQPGDTTAEVDLTDVPRTGGTAETMDLTEVPRTGGTARVVDLTQVLRTEGTAVVLDLDPLVAIRSAADVSRLGLAHVVLVLPRWPHTSAVLPTDDLAATLVQASNRLAAGAVSNNVVFVLDAEPHKPIRRPANDPRIDNRYPITATDLPNLATLRRGGVTRLVKVTSTG